MSDTTTIRVGPGSPGDAATREGYDVLVGTGLLGELPPLLGGAQRVLVVHPRALRATGDAVREDLGGQGFEAGVAEVPDGEEAKTSAVLAFCWQVLGQAGFTRSDAVVGVGGGAVTDLPGVVAGAWARRGPGLDRPPNPPAVGGAPPRGQTRVKHNEGHKLRRGLGVVHPQATVLGGGGAAVGGKPGINRGGGKTLGGPFPPPAGVLCALEVRGPLPRTALAGGLAGVGRCGFTADPPILDLVEA